LGGTPKPPVSNKSKNSRQGKAVLQTTVVQSLAISFGVTGKSHARRIKHLRRCIGVLGSFAPEMPVFRPIAASLPLHWTLEKQSTRCCYFSCMGHHTLSDLVQAHPLRGVPAAIVRGRHPLRYDAHRMYQCLLKSDAHRSLHDRLTDIEGHLSGDTERP
jgi:hypothetical protein